MAAVAIQPPLLTSSEVELMETHVAQLDHEGKQTLLTSSEVELMETGHRFSFDYPRNGDF